MFSKYDAHELAGLVLVTGFSLFFVCMGIAIIIGVCMGATPK